MFVDTVARGAGEVVPSTTSSDLHRYQSKGAVVVGATVRITGE